MKTKRSLSKSGVAIIGIGCRFPAAHGPNQFWHLLRDGATSLSEADSLSLAGLDDSGSPPRISFDDDDVAAFDAGFFGISPREARHMDPQHRMLLETTWEALEDSGIVPATLAGTRAGVFVAQASSDYLQLLLQANDLDFYSVVGTTRSMAAGRVSFSLDLRGPSVTVDSGCSSSLAAVHMARQSILSGESTLAIAGGINLTLDPDITAMYVGGSLLAADGKCKFGDERADGFVRGDGIGVIILKELAAAIEDGDPIRAVIVGSAVNNDGRSSKYLIAPGAASQEDLLTLAYEQAGIAPGNVDYLEAHGSGTAVGDPLEVRAAAKVLGRDRPADRPLLAGSVKTNIGHTEAAAGIAGLIKSVLILQNHIVPPSLHVEYLNPGIAWESSPLKLCDELTPLPDRGRPLIAGVTSLGLSGTNAHIVLAEYVADPATRARPPAAVSQEGPYLLPVSAKDEQGLRELALSYTGQLSGQIASRASLADVCRSAGERRTHHRKRLAVTGSRASDMAEALEDFVADGEPGDVMITERRGTRPPNVAFVFSGYGSQWTGMGRELLAKSPVFAAQLRECDEAIRAEAGWSLLDKLAHADFDKEGVDVTQPALWAMGVSLAALWRSWGIRPDWVIGHSQGEIAAACAAGALSVADSAAVICRRSALTASLAGRAGLALVGLDADRVGDMLTGGYAGHLSIAAVNGPSATLVAGEAAALGKLAEELSSDGVLFRRLSVPYASHSPQVDPILGELRSRLADIRPRVGHTPMYSTVLDMPVDGSELDASYWARNLRGTVWFAQAVSSVASPAGTIFLEVSPHPIAVSPMQETLRQVGMGIALPSLIRNVPAREVLLRSAGKLYTAGCTLNWAQVNGPCTTFVRPPAYPWRRDRFWMDQPPPARAARGPARLPEPPRAPRPAPAVTSYGEALPGASGALPRQAVPATPHGDIKLTVARCISQILGIPARYIDPSLDVSSLGLDSLMASEVVRELRSAGLEIPVATLLGDGTVQDAMTAAIPSAPGGQHAACS